MNHQIGRPIISVVIAMLFFVLGSIISGKNEYYILDPSRGENEITKEVFIEWQMSQDPYRRDVRKYLVKKRKPNLLIGMGIGSLTFLGIWLFNYPHKLLPSTSEPKKSISLREWARFYYELGFNLTIIKGKDNQMNTYQDSYKIPSREWEPYRNSRQSEDFINGQNWGRATGIGAISGISNYVCLDFDDCRDADFIFGFLETVKFPKDYSWIVQSGSGSGFHVWVKTEPNFRKIIPYPPNNTLFFFPRKTYNHLFKQIELKISDHIVLPPSISRSGNVYRFIQEKPTQPPNQINTGLLFNALDRVSFCKNTYEYHINKERLQHKILFVLILEEFTGHRLLMCDTDQYGNGFISIDVINDAEIDLNNGSDDQKKLILDIINWEDLVVTFDNKGLFKDFVKKEKANIRSNHSPILEVFELIRAYHNNDIFSLNDFHTSFNPFQEQHALTEKENLKQFVITFFKLAIYNRDIRYRFKQFLNSSIPLEQELPHPGYVSRWTADNVTQYEEIMKRDGFVRIKFNDPDNDSQKERTATLVLEELELDERKVPIRLGGFCFGECANKTFGLSTISKIVYNPLIIEYS